MDRRTKDNIKLFFRRDVPETIEFLIGMGIIAGIIHVIDVLL